MIATTYHTLTRTCFAGVLCLVLALCGFSTHASAFQPEEPPLAGPRAKKQHKSDGESKRGFKEGRRGWAPRAAGMEALDDDLPLPPEVVERVMEMVREKLPERFERLSDLRERNPERFERLVRHMVPMVREYSALSERDPEMAETIINEFRNQALLHELSRAYKEAEGDAVKQAEIEKEIAALARSQMEFFHQRMEFRLKDMEERIAQQQEFIQSERVRLEEEKAKIEERLAERIERIKQGDVMPDRMHHKRGFHRGQRGFDSSDEDAPMPPRGMRGDRPWRKPPPQPEAPDDQPEIGEF